MQGMNMFLFKFVIVLAFVTSSALGMNGAQVVVQDDAAFEAKLQELEACLLKMYSIKEQQQAKKEEEEAKKELSAILNKPKCIKNSIIVNKSK